MPSERKVCVETVLGSSQEGCQGSLGRRGRMMERELGERAGGGSKKREHGEGAGRLWVRRGPENLKFRLSMSLQELEG